MTTRDEDVPPRTGGDPASGSADDAPPRPGGGPAPGSGGDATPRPGSGSPPRSVLLTGATGYVGGRLLPTLTSAGHRVRCLARRPRHLRETASARVEAVEGDVLEYDTLPPAMEGVDVAYYLIHSMGSTGDFEARDRRAAENFARAAEEAGVERMVYLGGLGEGEDLSRHLRSRQDVGRILRSSGVPTAELRASIVLGSGSLSYEMIRSLVERLPVMVTPRWVRTRAQPIGIEDVLAYLRQALSVPLPSSRVFEIGGADVASYGEIMQEYARQRGLRRVMIPVPVLSPRLSSLWLGLVTPLYARVGKKLVTSLVHETVVRDPSAREVFDVEPLGLREAIRRALEREDARMAATRWSDAVSSAGEARSWGGVRFGNRIVDARSVEVPSPPEAAFRPVRRLGGSVGWYYADWLWTLRGFLDRMAGGVGTRRGRRDPERLSPGDTVDFWRVEEVRPPRLLRLRAEMKLPGRAWLQFEVEDVEEAARDPDDGPAGGADPARAGVGEAAGGAGARPDGEPAGGGQTPAAAGEPVGGGREPGRGEATVAGRRVAVAAGTDGPGGGPPRSRIVQTAIFDPVGLAGLAYWYALYPLHTLVFRGLLRGVARAAREAREAGDR